MSYYYKSEKEAAYWALKLLEEKLPATPMSAVESPEWGTIIFRWPDGEEGGYKYSFQEPLYKAIRRDGLWDPLGRIPDYAQASAYAHTHPNNSFYSTTDTATARGEGGLVKEPTVMYMVNRTGAYWYDGRTEYLAPSARYGVLWGAFPKQG
jgi:hypothetical protein